MIYELSQDFLCHYGVPGMKWGVITKEYVKKGYGNRSSDSGSSLNKSPPSSSRSYSVRKTASQQKQTQQDIEQQKRREQLKKVAIGAAFVAAAVGISYAAYKYNQTTTLRDQMRKEAYGSINTDFSNVHTLNSKYWDDNDKKEYKRLSQQRRSDIASGITRRDALSELHYQKTGERKEYFKTRKETLKERESANRYANFIRDAEERGHLNRKIDDARKDLEKAQNTLDRYKSTTHIGTSKQYEDFWIGRHSDNVESARKRLEEVLRQKVA